MRYVDSWATSDRKVLVYFTPEVVQTFAKHRQRYPRQPESGGVLLGRRRGRHFEVVHATSPFPSDKQWWTGFARERGGHQAAATDLWAASRGEVDYIGEWHTHPEAEPSPSGIDRREWRLLASRRVRGAALVTAIVGIASLCVALLMRGQIDRLVEAA